MFLLVLLKMLMHSISPAMTSSFHMLVNYAVPAQSDSLAMMLRQLISCASVLVDKDTVILLFSVCVFVLLAHKRTIASRLTTLVVAFIVFKMLYIFLPHCKIELFFFNLAADIQNATLSSLLQVLQIPCSGLNFYCFEKSIKAVYITIVLPEICATQVLPAVLYHIR